MGPEYTVGPATFGSCLQPSTCFSTQGEHMLTQHHGSLPTTRILMRILSLSSGPAYRLWKTFQTNGEWKSGRGLLPTTAIFCTLVAVHDFTTAPSIVATHARGSRRNNRVIRDVTTYVTMVSSRDDKARIETTLHAFQPSAKGHQGLILV
eukprot:5241173-Amphidinium_carterae.1